MTEAAAQWLVARRPKSIGCDFFEEPAASAGIPLIEGLVNLAQRPGRVEFFAPFYHFAGIDSVPARAFAIVL